MREDEIIGRIRRGELQFPPLEFRLLSNQPTSDLPDRRRGDGLLELKWGDKAATFLFDVKTIITPRSINEAAQSLKDAAEALGLYPLLVGPYFKEDRLLELQKLGVSALDINGNGVIVTSDMNLWKSGKPSQVREKGPKRNPYGGDSSVFTRSFLLRSRFDSLNELREFTVGKVAAWDPDGEVKGLNLSTASRVVDALVEDLVVFKDKRALRLVDEVRLMDNLKKGFRLPGGERLLGRTDLSATEIWSRLDEGIKEGSLTCVATGLSSAGWYRALSGVTVLGIYVSDIELAKELVPIKPGKAFSNIELIEESRLLVYFDARKTEDGIWSSPIQCWLELATGGPREQEASEVLKHILRNREAEGGE